MSSSFASQLRARPGVVRLAPAGASSVWTVRAQVAEAWDVIRLETTPDTRVADVKQAALGILMPDADGVDAFEVKHRGEIVAEQDTLSAAGVKDGSTLLVIGKRKRPVR